MIDETDDRIDAALAAARTSLAELDARCCEPGRSPRMADLARRLDVIGRQIEAGTDVADVVAELEAAGAAIGALQIGCCAPNRLPRYADMLRELTTVQRLVTGIDT